MINISARPPANLSLFGFKSSRRGGAIACPVALIIIIIIIIIIIFFFDGQKRTVMDTNFLMHINKLDI